MNNNLMIFGILLILVFGLVVFLLKIQPTGQNPSNLTIEQRQIFDIGHSHGIRGVEPHQIYYNNPHYIRGYEQGSRSCPNGPKFSFGINFR